MSDAAQTPAVASTCVEFVDVQLSVDGRRYLHGADLSVATGESVVIIGPPGCGKSFVPRLVLGLPGLEPDQVECSGTVRVQGASLPPQGSLDLQNLRRRIGSVLRDGGLIENMDIRTNVSLPLTYHYRDVLEPTDIQARCDMLLAAFQLEHLGSAGIRPVAVHRQERIYVALARALICEPMLLLCDEPCAGLAPATARCLLERVFSYEPAFQAALPGSATGREPLTRIVTTGDPVRYLPWADRFVLLWQGRLESIGDGAALLASDDARIRQLLDKDHAGAGSTRLEVAHG